MTFEIHSNITNRSMTVAARAMRRVLRRKRSIMWAIFGWSVFLFNALLLIPFDGEPFALDARTLISLLAEVISGFVAEVILEVVPLVEATDHIDVPDSEIRVDTYCSSGRGMKRSRRETGWWITVI